MNQTNAHICAALLNRNLTHGSFRIYSALVVAADGRSGPEVLALSVPELKNLLPGVKGKPLGETVLRAALAELQSEGLIEVFGPRWSKVSVQIRLTEPPGGGHAGREIRGVRLDAPGEEASR